MHIGRHKSVKTHTFCSVSGHRLLFLSSCFKQMKSLAAVN